MTHRFDPTTGILELRLHVQPGARVTQWAGRHGDAFKLRLAAPPVEGRANAALLRFLADAFEVPLRQVTLLSGAQGRQKRVAIAGSPIDIHSLIDEITNFTDKLL